MLSEICREIRNWFDRNQPKMYGSFVIADGKITDSTFNQIIQENQYFRIMGSVFNDGVYKNTNKLELTDEEFEGAIWLMAVPKEIIALDSEIEAWLEKNGEVMHSPYQSESFGGYSYVKASGGANGSVNTSTWKSAFATELNRWRKI